MNIYIVLYLASIGIVHATSIGIFTGTQEYNLTKTDDSTATKNASIEDKIKEFRIKMVKFQMQSSMNLEDAPPSVGELSEASKEIIKVLSREEEWKQKQNGLDTTEEQLVIHAKTDNKRCLYSNSSSCGMHYFDLSQYNNTSYLDLWIYKYTNSFKWVSISVYSSTSSDGKVYDFLYHEADQVGWNKIKIPSKFTFPLQNESSLTVEINGPNIEHTGEFRPFLMISKLALIPTRQRRDVSCNMNESCCWRPFTVSFAEIGFNWVVYPNVVNVNFCLGPCTKDPSRTPYEIAMLKLLEKDNSIDDLIGDCWTLCCKPKELESVRVIYRDINETIHVHRIAKLSVKSCGCS